MVYFGISETNTMVRAEDGMGGQAVRCPRCANSLIWVRGSSIKDTHFRHHAGESCVSTASWTHDDELSRIGQENKMSKFHLDWQNQFPLTCLEKFIEEGGVRHYADIYLPLDQVPDGIRKGLKLQERGKEHLVIEVQHSCLSPAAINERNRFYRSASREILWILDATRGVSVEKHGTTYVLQGVDEHPLLRKFQQAKFYDREYERVQARFAADSDDDEAWRAWMDVKLTQRCGYPVVLDTGDPHVLWWTTIRDLQRDETVLYTARPISRDLQRFHKDVVTRPRLDFNLKYNKLCKQIPELANEIALLSQWMFFAPVFWFPSETFITMCPDIMTENDIDDLIGFNPFDKWVQYELPITDIASEWAHISKSNARLCTFLVSWWKCLQAHAGRVQMRKGKHAGAYLCDIPRSYLRWMAREYSGDVERICAHILSIDAEDIRKAFAKPIPRPPHITSSFVFIASSRYGVDDDTIVPDYKRFFAIYL